MCESKTAPKSLTAVAGAINDSPTVTPGRAIFDNYLDLVCYVSVTARYDDTLVVIALAVWNMYCVLKLSDDGDSLVSCSCLFQSFRVFGSNC